MVYGVISLIVAQILLVILTATAYLRIRAKEDTEKHDRISWGIEVKAAVNTANAAKAMVDTIELSHYKALLAKFEAQGLEISELKKEVASLRNEVISLRTKNASEARAALRQSAREREAVEVGAILAQAEGQPVPAATSPVQSNGAAPRRFGAIP